MSMQDIERAYWREQRAKELQQADSGTLEEIATREAARGNTGGAMFYITLAVRRTVEEEAGLRQVTDPKKPTSAPRAAPSESRFAWPAGSFE
jgi:hypothetical protein